MLIDLVSCTYCDFKGDVDRWVDTCPNCKKPTLLDIEQDIDR